MKCRKCSIELSMLIGGLCWDCYFDEFLKSNVKKKMNLTICQNGVVTANKVYKFETEKPDKSDIEEMERMIWDILEEAGYLNRKFDKYALETRIVHGSHYECKEKKCKHEDL